MLHNIDDGSYIIPGYYYIQCNRFTTQAAVVSSAKKDTKTEEDNIESI